MTRAILAAVLLVPSVVNARQLPPTAQPPRPVATDTLPANTARLQPVIRRGWTIGVTGYTGGTWQPSGVDAGLVWKVGVRPGRTVALSMRIGSFTQDQAVLVGRTRGFFSALLGQYRFPLLRVMELGTPETVTGAVRLDGLLESGVSVNFNSPLPQGNYHGLGAAMLGFAFGGTEPIDESFGFFFGAATLVGGGETTTHFTASLRYQSRFGARRR